MTTTTTTTTSETGEINNETGAWSPESLGRASASCCCCRRRRCCSSFQSDLPPATPSGRMRIFQTSILALHLGALGSPIGWPLFEFQTRYYRRCLGCKQGELPSVQAQAFDFRARGWRDWPFQSINLLARSTRKWDAIISSFKRLAAASGAASCRSWLHFAILSKGREFTGSWRGARGGQSIRVTSRKGRAPGEPASKLAGGGGAARSVWRPPFLFVSRP